MVQTATWTSYRVPASLPTDTEESIVGTEWHQEAIGALADMLWDVADRRGARWGVCEQVALAGLQYPNGDPYDPRPDVMVLAQPLPSGSLASIHLRDAGTPLFIADVASESTARNDVGAKRQVYEAIGVPEYIVFDAVGNVLPAPLRAWRLEGSAYVPWEPDADGWWWSAVLEVALRATQPLLSVRDRDGTLIEPSRQVRRRLRAVEGERDTLIQRVAALEEQLQQVRKGHSQQSAERVDHVDKE